MKTTATPAEVPASAVLHFVATVKNRYTKPDAALFLLRPDRTLPRHLPAVPTLRQRNTCHASAALHPVHPRRPAHLFTA
jgi:hypothetical protein